MPDDVVEKVVEEVALAEQPGEETPPEETHEGFIALDKHQKDVNVQHKKFRDQERGRVAAEERAKKAEDELEALKGSGEPVVVPPVPDRYSDTYEADLATRDNAIKAQAEQEAEGKRQDDKRKTDQEAAAATEETAMKERVAGFDSNMVTHGLNPVTTKTAADKVIEYGINDTFTDILLEDPDGPLFVQYLSENPVELGEMNAMTPLQLVNHMNGDIRAKALLLKPQTSNAPDPPITPRGGGVPEQQEPWEKGAKYE